MGSRLQWSSEVGKERMGLHVAESRLRRRLLLLAARISENGEKVGGDIEEDSSRVEGEVEAKENADISELGAGCRLNIAQRLELARNGMMGAARSANCDLLSSHHLHRSNDDMKLEKLLSLPKIHRRGRSQPRNEIGATEASGDADPVAPRPAESTPDLGLGVSTPSRLASPDQESNGMQNFLSWRRCIQPLFSRGTDRPSMSDRFRSAFRTGRSKNQNPSRDDIGQSPLPENKSKLKSLASSGAKFILRGAKESTDACPQLKSVLGALCFILDNYEVRGSNTPLALRY